MLALRCWTRVSYSKRPYDIHSTWSHLNKMAYIKHFFHKKTIRYSLRKQNVQWRWVALSRIRQGNLEENSLEELTNSVPHPFRILLQRLCFIFNNKPCTGFFCCITRETKYRTRETRTRETKYIKYSK